MKVKLVKILKPDGSSKYLGISALLDKVLQTQFLLLSDPFYEAKYPEHMYGFRKGRTVHQAVGFLQAVLKKWVINPLGLILFEIEKCLGNISHQTVLIYLAVSDKWKSLLSRWLKVIIVHKINESSLIMHRGKIRSSVIVPMIFNVIINKALFKTAINSMKLALFLDFKSTNWILVKKSQQNICRNITVYVYDIVIITTNPDEIRDILIAVSNSFLEFGLNISKMKSQVINYLSGKPVKFKYLGFYFVYVSTKYIKKSVVLTCFYDIIDIKLSKAKKGTFLVYPSSITFRNFKNKCKSFIKLLLKTSFVEVLSQINLIIQGFSNYYA